MMKPMDKMLRCSLLLIPVLMLTLSACSPQSESKAENGSEAVVYEKSELEAFTGAHTRVVWVQDQGDGSDSFAAGDNLKVLGYDSRDGKGVRQFTSEVSNYYKPILSPDGQWILVSDRVKHKIFKINFVSGKVKEFAEGVAVDVWQDPKNEKTWVYAFAGDGDENLKLTKKPLVRYRLDKPKKKELIWNKTPLSWSNLDLSLDGQMIGGLFPWPKASVLDVDNGKLTRIGKGCWTSLSPDNNKILWIFDGAHRNLGFTDIRTGAKWTTTINGAPGIEGYEVYHPRWSNHFNYFAMTGPYKEGEGGNKIRGGGKKVELYFGKLANDLKTVSSWYQLTSNDLADFYPDLWIEGAQESGHNYNKLAIESEAASSYTGNWPVVTKPLFYLWQDFQASNQLPDDSLFGFAQNGVIAKGRGIFNRFGEMSLRGGGFVAEFDWEKGLTTVKNNGYLGIELLFTPLAGSEEKGVLLSYGGEKGSMEVFKLSEGISVHFPEGENVQVAEASLDLQKNKPITLYLELKGNTVRLFADGKEVIQKTVKVNPLTQLGRGGLHFGQVSKAHSGISGAISHVALYGKPLTAKDILQNSQAMLNAAARRVAAPVVEILGELVEVSAVPAPDSLGAYSRALTVNRYKVKKIVAGEYTEQEVLVAQWAVLDRQVLPEAAAREIGQEEQLRIELFDDHPELEGERLMMDMFDPDLEVYYVVE